MIAITASQLGSAIVAGGVFILGVAARHRAIPTHRRVQVGASNDPHVRRSLMGPWRRRALAVLCALGAAIVAGPMPAVLGFGAIVLWRSLRPLRWAGQRRRTIERDLPAVMDLLVLSVRAGLTPHHAVVDLAGSAPGPVGDAFTEVVRRTERGQPFADALVALGELLGPQAAGLADVIATSDRHGLPLGAVLDQLTAETRAARRRLDQADARKLPIRLSFPLVMCTLPSFVLLAIVPAVLAALSSLGAPAS